jgi:hypothetical protein
MRMNMVRHLAERFSRGKVFRRRLPARFGGAQFYASPEAGLAIGGETSRRSIPRCSTWPRN